MSEQEKMHEEERNQHEEMDEFERALTRALRRVEVRAETAAKFLAIAAEAKDHQRRTGRRWYTPESGGRVFVMPKPRVWMGGAIAAMLALGVFGAEQVHVRHERVVQAALAQQQFETAARITDQALEHAREQLARAGVLQDLGLRDE
jgi:hypothetical protein